MSKLPKHIEELLSVPLNNMRGIEKRNIKDINQKTVDN